MDNISAILTSLSTEEFKKLDKYFDDINASKDRKDKKLLKILTRDDDLSTDEIIRELYDIDFGVSIPTNKRNSYHQWRSILSDQLDNFIVQGIDSGDTSQYIVKLMLVARFLLLRKKYNAAFKYLQKAEGIAQKMERYELLQRIYSIQIDYAWSQSDLDFEGLLKKWKENTELEHKETNFNTALGVLKRQLKVIKLKGDSIDFDLIISNILKEYRIDIESDENAFNQYRIAKIVQVTLEEKDEFEQLTNYLIKTYNRLESHHLFNKHNQIIKIKFLSNILYFSAKCFHLKTAEKYFTLLKKEEEYSKEVNFSNIKRYLSEVGFLALSKRLPEAIELLNKMAIDPQIKAVIKVDDFQFVRFYNNLFGYHFFYLDYVNAQKALTKLLNNEQKIKSSFGYRHLVSIHICDCFLQIEKNETEYVISKLNAVQKRFKLFLTQPENHYYKEVLDILKLMATKPEITKSNMFIEKVEECIKNKPVLFAKYEIIPFNIYLLSKIKNRTVYDIILENIPTDY